MECRARVGLGRWQDKLIVSPAVAVHLMGSLWGRVSPGQG